MKHPVARISAIVALLGLGLYVGMQYSDPPPSEPMVTRDAAARAKLEERLDLALPRDAKDVMCYMLNTGKINTVLARFTVPEYTLHSRRLPIPQYSALVPNTSMPGRIAGEGDTSISGWWIPHDLSDPRGFEAEGQYENSSIKYHLWICCGPDRGGGMLVYIALREEPQ